MFESIKQALDKRRQKRERDAEVRYLGDGPQSEESRTFVARWDSSYPISVAEVVPTQEKLDALVEFLIEQHARKGSFDSGTPDLLDRELAALFAAVRAELQSRYAGAQQDLRTILNQGLEHEVRLGQELGRMREAAKKHAYFANEALNELTGSGFTAQQIGVMPADLIWPEENSSKEVNIEDNPDEASRSFQSKTLPSAPDVNNVERLTNEKEARN